jgi:vacuolar-type H+-ATPase subunit E/Vma4
MINAISTIEKKIDFLVQKRVNEVIREILSDPDYGLEFTPEFIKRLKKSIASKKTGRVVSLEKILKKYKKL